MAGHRVEKALILAAGQGSRMGDLGREMPKALAPVVNRPLLVRHLEMLAANGVCEAHVVIGHLGHLIREALAAHPVPGITVHYHEQTERLGLGHAVLQAEDGLAGAPFVLILADIAFALDDADALLVLPEGVAGLVAVKTEQDIAPIKRNFSVIHEAGGRITQVIEKPQNPPNMLKGTGQYTFGPEIFDAIRATPRSKLRNEYELTDAIQTLIDTGVPVMIANTITWDLNLTFPADLLACNRRYMAELPKDARIASTLPEGRRVAGSVIGPEVTADGPVEIEDCVILNGAHLAAGTSLRGAVVASNGIWMEDDLQ